ncbi:MAG: RagB/SusD family nutrient uptake outer membrane protein [Bacteroidota bacterium]
MKRYILLLSVVMASMTFTSCDDAIDIEQPGLLLEEDAFNSVDDLELNLSYLMGEFNHTAQIEHAAVWTDEVGIGFGNGGQGLGGSYLFQMNSGSAFASNIWLNYNRLLNFSNRLIDGGERIEIEEGEEATVADIVAQARAIRAYAHFGLVSYFSTDITDDNALGGIILDFVPETEDHHPRRTNGDIFNFIDDDLDFAEDNLTTTDVTFVNPDFITALRARMAIYREQYDLAEQYADDLIGSNSLSQPGEYANIWLDQANGEVLFKLRRVTGDSRIGRLFASVDATIDGSPFYEMSRALYNELEQGEDIRYDVLVHPTSEPDPNYETSPDYRNSDILLINKYPGTQFNHLADIKIFRLSEMYLIKAEAQIGNSDLPGAAQTLKDLRDARSIADETDLDTYNNERQAWAAVLDERRVELAYEGHRWLDLKRLRFKAQESIDRDPMDCEEYNACTIPIDDYRYTLPIPASELIPNEAIGEEDQNPNY